MADLALTDISNHLESLGISKQLNAHDISFDLFDDGYDEGYAAGEAAGYTAGETAGYATGYTAGETAGYATGYAAGETAGYATGYAAGETAGHDAGYDEGYADALETIDVTPPTVENFLPAGPVNPSSGLGFDVLDETGLSRVLVVATFATLGATELVYDGEDFVSPYTGQVTSITGGYRFSGVRRAGGWSAAPRITIYPFDSAGNQSS